MILQQAFVFDRFPAWMGQILILGSIVGLVSIAIAASHRQKLRMRQLELLEAALKSQQVPSDVQRELAAALGIQRRRPSRWMFASGWFGLFGGITWLCMDPHGREFIAAVVTTVMSFALMTYPFALRELEARRA